MSPPTATEDLLRELAPQVLGVVVRRSGDFPAAEDATQEALLAAAEQWPTAGVPDNPTGWLVHVAKRRLIDAHRRDGARRQREDRVAQWAVDDRDPAPSQDDTLILLFMCGHPALTPGSAIPLTLRAVGGLTTREIAAAFLVPEATMAQRISRAKAKVAASGAPFALPSETDRAERLGHVLRVLYLLFNEGYATSAGPDLARTDLSGEAIRLARGLHAELPDDPEVTGLLALMLLTDARRPARTDADGALVPLGAQDRSLWDRGLITEGLTLMVAALSHRAMGEYQIQAAIAGVHAEARTAADTDWVKIAALYGRLASVTANPMVTLSRATAVAMADGPSVGLAVLDEVADELGTHHRFHAVRGHLLQQAGDRPGAVAEYRAAAAGATNQREQTYLLIQAARLAQAEGPEVSSVGP